MAALPAENLAPRFFGELATVSAFSCFGASLGGPDERRVTRAVLRPAAAVTMLAIFLAQRACRPLPGPLAPALFGGVAPVVGCSAGAALGAMLGAVALGNAFLVRAGPAEPRRAAVRLASSS